eukprot:1148145-Pelagomonas_calceolata.AAC.2
MKTQPCRALQEGGQCGVNGRCPWSLVALQLKDGFPLNTPLLTIQLGCYLLGVNFDEEQVQEVVVVYCAFRKWVLLLGWRGRGWSGGSMSRHRLAQKCSPWQECVGSAPSALGKCLAVRRVKAS